MKICQKRVNKIAFLDEYINKKIRIAIPYSTELNEKLERIGFTPSFEMGESVLPKKIGPATKKNAEGYEIIHKDRPKEIKISTRLWTRQEWAGRDHTREVTDLVQIPYERYPRTSILPYGVELMITKDQNNQKMITTSEILCDECNLELIKNTINMYLEIFGECHILLPNMNIIQPSQFKKLNWEILPHGQYPWEVRREQVRKFIEKASKGNRATIDFRLETINSFHPDFTAMGLNGFNGYLIFGFTDKDIYILESTVINNATYILEKDWEELSKLTKREILSENLHKARIIHKLSWKNDITELLES
ncbi:hypothetical protein [Methanimicrococcus blatticola]|uniref:Uncharacterized protein n=1 Tax=Methanimicrococcus blatticola TaxID=91560 RepID=A0A484F641_9EURY|nr:hypothetical protein [Methanimicrococcus blatticola]MBZ3935179.1 hypothetical protein [Methanimicrococcus blatticola]MCC2508724.1 hypothetical protein [Methanimicrococcus blatticola]TDQ71240.1 hypothetical protein C7391_0345 [Methanimicrococcus blatticola]